MTSAVRFMLRQEDKARVARQWGVSNDEASAWQGGRGKVGMEHDCGIVDNSEREEENAEAARGCDCDSLERGEERGTMWRRHWQ